MIISKFNQPKDTTIEKLDSLRVVGGSSIMPERLESIKSLGYVGGDVQCSKCQVKIVKSIEYVGRKFYNMDGNATY